MSQTRTYRRTISAKYGNDLAILTISQDGPGYGSYRVGMSDGAVTDYFDAEIGSIRPSLSIFLQLDRVTVLGERSNKFFRKNHLDHRRVVEYTKIADPMVLDSSATITANFHQRYGFRG